SGTGGPGRSVRARPSWPCWTARAWSGATTTSAGRRAARPRKRGGGPSSGGGCAGLGRGGARAVLGGARRGPCAWAAGGAVARGRRGGLRSARVHAGIGRSLEEADAALMRAKKASVASGERAERGRRPRGLAEVLGWRPRSEKGRDSGLRFYLRALQAADPDFDAPALEDESRMSREWRVRSLR